MTVTCEDGHSLYRCSLCETVFEAGVAGDDAEGIPRCPQCGLSESSPIDEAGEEDLVIRRTSKFR